jgi:Fe-S-cluster containining protein
MNTFARGPYRKSARLSATGRRMTETGTAPQAFLIEIDTPEGPLRGHLAVPPRPVRLAELAWIALPLDGKLVQLCVRRHAPDPGAISCQKGCGACCRQVVPLSPPEAWMLHDLVRQLPPDHRDRVRDRFGSAQQALSGAGLKGAFEGRIETAEQLHALSLAYFRMGVPCPFLEEESCSIHPYRPSICREYLVTSPAEHCADLGRRRIARVPVSVRMSEALSRVTARLFDTEPVVIPMVLALDWAEAHAEEGRRRWDVSRLMEMLVQELGRPRQGALEPEPDAERADP